MLKLFFVEKKKNPFLLGLWAFGASEAFGAFEAFEAFEDSVIMGLWRLCWLWSLLFNVCIPQQARAPQI